MARKVFISILGTGFYEKCKYQHENFISDEVRFVQEAILQQIGTAKWSGEDVAIILLTDKARKENWNREIKLRKKYGNDEVVEYEGLEARIEKMQLPMRIQAPDIPDGKNETEMWDVFKILFDLINDEDELYFDLTHSFRYLPMLLLVFGNYVKFLKKAKVAHISYGNYEARDMDKNIAPIIDLLPISALQDWTFASANYLENGNVKRLVELCNHELKPILKDELRRTENAKTLKKFIASLEKVIEERQTCRGISILKSDNLRNLKFAANQLPKTLFEPLNPVFDKIKESLSSFDENQNVMNGFAAARWCFNFGLYQQAATILQENIVSYFCLRHNINYDDEKQREIINKAFNIKANNKPQANWKIDENEKERLKSVLSDEYFQEIELLELFSNLTDLRNDVNHSGMRSKKLPFTPQSLIQNIEKCLIGTEKILAQSKTIYSPFNENRKFINLTNHPSSRWDEPQLTAAGQYGQIIDLPFPIINAHADEQEIEYTVNEYFEKIKLQYKPESTTIHIMGELTFCFALIGKLQSVGFTCIASTSERSVVDLNTGQKQVNFIFVRFRKYTTL